jgi:hypothetical protein
VPGLLALAALVVAAVPAASAAGPVISYTVTSGTAGDNGWYLTNVTASISVSAATDTTCPAVKTFTQSSDALDCTATDGTSTVTFHLQFKIDKDAPAVTSKTAGRAPDAHGWYRAPVTVTYAGSDGTSGIASCSQPTYSGPDSGSASVTGTCRDLAGRVSASSTFGLEYDATAPTVTAALDRTADSNGWFNHPVGLNVSGSDGMSGLDSCTKPPDYSSPDSSSGSLSGSCTDLAGNTASRSVTLKYDATPPTVSSSLSSQPNANGWHKQPVSFTVTGTNDATSGLAGCTPTASYSGPDTNGAQLTGSCSDTAGNSTSRSTTIKYDATPPTATAALSRPADRNGWHNHPVSLLLTGNDTTSGIDSCTSPGYSNPDSATATLSGTCTDKAGNQSPTTSTNFKYDATAPNVTAALERTADSNGWFNHPVGLTLTGDDATSGLDGCDAPGYTGPDTATAQVTGSCTDEAGNTTTRSATVQYDATPPDVTAAFDRAADQNGWYNHAVQVTLSATDGLSGLDGCTQPPVYTGPDDAAAQVAGSCRDKAGNATNGGGVLRYDATAPSVSAGLTRQPDAGGWFNHPVSLALNASDPASGVASCTQAGYGGPDTAGVSLGGTCVDRAGNQSSASSVTVKYDATPPAISASLDRGPDAGGWFNHAVTLATSGTDGLSGLASCTSPSYAGPDAPAVSLTATCTDKAGNAVSRTVSLRYDSTPPRLSNVTVASRNRSLLVSWSASADAVSVTVTRSAKQVYLGTGRNVTDRGLRNGVRYRYAVAAVDEAGNAATLAVAGVPRALRTPAEGARVSGAPRLSWWPDPKADYYNVQVLRAGRKILSLWPAAAALKLHETWTYLGRRYRLVPGIYRWYVFPGIGARAANDYGPLLGAGTFQVVR